MRGGRPNNRKAPNPLTRSYESNGPDVKIRGTAHHVGEKYLQLARDAQSSGDPVMAESYLQHAEHYFRLIAAAQQAQQQAALGVQRPESEADDDDDDDDFTGLTDRFASPPERFAQPQAPSFAPQPAANGGQPYQERPYYNNSGNGHNSERPYEQRGPRPERNYQERSYQDRTYQDRNGQDRSFQDRNNQDRNSQDRTFQDRNSQDRPSYQDRQLQDRNGQDRNGQERNSQERQGQDRNGQDRQQGRDQDQRNNSRNSRRDYREPREPRPVMQDTETALPAFITAPVRIPPEHVETPVAEPVPRAMEQAEPESDAFLLRPRRRRRTKAEMQEFREANARDPVGE
jgi:hypothetical protein